MKFKILGKTGLKVSVIGFGASPLGEEFGKINPAEGKRAVDYALDHGINYFDVAPYYGRTLAEKRLGDYLKGKRKKVILATKTGRYGSSLPEGFDFSPKRVQTSVEESLIRLQTDYIDVFQIHDIEFGNREQIIEETIPAMYKLKEQGKIRFVGITGYPVSLLKSVAEDREIDTILSYCRYNLMDTTMDDILTPLALQKNIGLINASPLHMRILTKDGAPDWHPAPKNVVEKGKEIAEFCDKQGINIAELAMQFVLAHEYVAVTLVGMSKVEHVATNLKALQSKFGTEILEAVLNKIKPAANIVWQEGIPENFESNAVPKQS